MKSRIFSTDSGIYDLSTIICLDSIDNVVMLKGNSFNQFRGTLKEFKKLRSALIDYLGESNIVKFNDSLFVLSHVSSMSLSDFDLLRVTFRGNSYFKSQCTEQQFKSLQMRYKDYYEPEISYKEKTRIAISKMSKI